MGTHTHGKMDCIAQMDIKPAERQEGLVQTVKNDSSSVRQLIHF